MGPYTKTPTAAAIDDGWEITDGDGAVIAILDTELLADAVLEFLVGPALLSREYPRNVPIYPEVDAHDDENVLDNTG